jgi:hypothetical protein
VPVIAVDFSLANLTFDESCYCLHSLKEGQPNDYLEALGNVYRAYSRFSQFMLAYGIGARTAPGEGPACSLFSMTGEYMDPYIESCDQLINSYSGTLKSVKLALPVKFSPLIKLICDLAQLEFGFNRGIKSIKNYFIVAVLMAGVIDDFEATLNKILEAAHLPVSVIFIKVGASQEDNDSSALRKLSEQAFKECERNFIDVLVYEKYKSTVGGRTTGLTQMAKQQIEFDLIKNIPKQVEKFFEIQ